MKYTFTQVKDESLESIKEKYKDIPEDKLMELLKLNPNYKDNEVDNYGRWILNLYRKGNLKEEDFYKVTDYLTEFERKKKLIQNKDINSYKTLPDLARTLEQTQEPDQSQNQLRKKIRRTDLDVDADFIGDFGNFACYSPKTYEASCKLGANTEWCTASRSNNNMFNYYNNQGKLYIFIDKSTNQAEYQFHFESGSFMDKYDKPIDLGEFMKDICPQSKSLIFSKIKEICKEKPRYVLRFMMYDEIAEVFKEEIKKALHFKGDSTTILLEPDFFASACVRNGNVGGSRDGLSEDFLESAFRQDLWDMFYYDDIGEISSYEDALNSSNIEQLEELHLSFMNIPPDEGDITLDSVISDAHVNGAINECLKDTNRALEEAFENCGMKYKEFDGDYLEIEVDYNTYCKLVKGYMEKAEELYPYEDFDDSSIDFAEHPDKIVVLYASEQFELREPYYGWQDFDEDSFNEGVHDLIMQIRDGEIEPIFDDEEEEAKWKRWFRINIQEEDDVAEGQQGMDLGDSKYVITKDKKDLNYVYKHGFVYRDKDGKLKRKSYYEIEDYYEDKYLGKGKFTKAQIHNMIEGAIIDCEYYIKLHKDDKPVEIPQTKKGYKGMSKKEYINYLINAGYSDVDAEEKADAEYGEDKED